MRWRDTAYIELTPDHGAGPQISVASDAHRWLRHYAVAGDPVSVDRAIKDFLGGAEVKSRGATKYVSRTLPHHIPFRRPDGLNYLWAVGCNVTENYTPQGTARISQLDPQLLPSFRWAKLDVTYVALRYTLRDDEDSKSHGAGAFAGIPDEGAMADGPRRYVTVFRKPWVKLTTLPRFLMKWVAEAGDLASVPVTEGQTYTESGQVLTVIWHGVPSAAYPDAAVGRLLGTVNSARFLGCQPETLLFETADPAPIVLPDGAPGYDVTYTLRRKENVARTNTAGATAGVTVRGWNWYPRNLTNTGDMDFRRLTSNGLAGGVAPYRTADFAAAFRPPG